MQKTTIPRETSSQTKAKEKIETFELSKKEHPYIPASTTKILSKFSRDSPPDLHHVALQERTSVLQKHRETVNDLRNWAKVRESNAAVKFLLRIVFRKGVKIRMPSEQKLYQSIDYFFPSRSELRVIICDFGEGRAERSEVRLGDIEKEFKQKPPWATVRWIHAPLGVGLLHSTVEALFFHTGSKVMGRPFNKAGRAGWPYLETETFDLRSTKYVQDSRDILRILKNEDGISNLLDRRVFVGDNNQNLRKDLTWRAQYVGKSLGFWDLAEADLPWQISEGSYLNMNGPSEGVRTTKLQSTRQSLSRHALFRDACVARNPFRCFHRNDGFLLTMSPAAGVDYLNANLPHYLLMSQQELLRDNFASAIAQVYLEFSETGTETWYRKNIEWFMVFLMTEVGTTPHNIRQGYSVPSLMDAYDAIIHELKQRRYDPWQRNETINLVRAYLVCIDEVTILGEIFSKKLDFFQRLKLDCETFELQEDNNVVDNPEGEKPFERIAFAEKMMEESSTHCKRLNADLRESLNTLFQLRSIEQNELAIMADNKNKAIFVFTAVTIVFLPLSFFTSYYGMNLQGFSDTPRTEAYFWKVCGSSAFGIIILVCLYAFRHPISQSLGVSTAKEDT